MPPQSSDGCRVRDLVNRFLTVKEAMRDSGELSGRSFRDYFKACGKLVEHFGRERLVEDIRVEDFDAYRSALYTGRGLHAIGTQVTLCRMIFNFGYDNELIGKPVRFGQNFKRPSRKSMRIERATKQNEHRLKMFEAADCHKLIESASPQLKVMILLALNGGLGASDLAALPRKFISRG